MDIGPTKAHDRAGFDVMWGQFHLVAGIIGYIVAIAEAVQPDRWDINLWASIWFASYALSQWTISRLKSKKG